MAFLTRNVSPISLLTSPIMVGTDHSSLKMETNLIHDNGLSISLMSKEIADAIGLHGETKSLGLATIGDEDVIKQAFKAQINVHDADGKEMGKAWIHVVAGFVDRKAVDWSTQAAKFPHLASINFPAPFIKGKCHVLIGNDNHHLSVANAPTINASDNPQAYPYAYRTPLGWCAAGPTMPPAKDDPVMSLLVKTATQEYQTRYRDGIQKSKSEAVDRKK
jgi:hypothetical protein